MSKARAKGLTRRWFIGGAAAFGGCRFLEGTASAGRPLLRFGVVSDIHYYELACSSGGKTVVKRIAARNAWLSEADPHATEATVASLPLKDLPTLPLSVTATPVGYFGKRGKPLSAVFSRDKWEPPTVLGLM